ncbi:hypothetical protein DFJ73DRAFT_864001 [Zopfochytrium polystomum]|nr:hypothetical protein DFJ73DRAFT_864001 [Zopfochytrium polystomum]
MRRRKSLSSAYGRSKKGFERFDQDQGPHPLAAGSSPHHDMFSVAVDSEADRIKDNSSLPPLKPNSFERLFSPPVIARSVFVGPTAVGAAFGKLPKDGTLAAAGADSSHFVPSTAPDESFLGRIIPSDSMPAPSAGLGSPVPTLHPHEDLVLAELYAEWSESFSRGSTGPLVSGDVHGAAAPKETGRSNSESLEISEFVELFESQLDDSGSDGASDHFAAAAGASGVSTTAILERGAPRATTTTATQAPLAGFQSQQAHLRQFDLDVNDVIPSSSSSHSPFQLHHRIAAELKRQQQHAPIRPSPLRRVVVAATPSIRSAQSASESEQSSTNPAERSASALSGSSSWTDNLSQCSDDTLVLKDDPQ